MKQTFTNFGYAPNKLFKRDSQRVAFSLCVDFSDLGGLRRVRYCVAHPLTGRYVAGENMEVLNQLFPSENQMERLKSSPESGEIHLLNLFKFKEKAEYADGRETNLTGKEAYELYGQPMLKVLEKYGAEVVFYSEVTGLILGQVEDLWDSFVIVRYPSRQALLEMTSSDEFLALSVHREAGLAGQLNIETKIP
ncbi:DUF1330 domain-containing protein [Vibrio harveyi]